jgi:hypothetical protein
MSCIILLAELGDSLFIDFKVLQTLFILTMCPRIMRQRVQDEDTLPELSPVPTEVSSTFGVELQGHLYNPVADIAAPDGGLRAWLVVFGGFINFITAFGTPFSSITSIIKESRF